MIAGVFGMLIGTGCMDGGSRSFTEADTTLEFPEQEIWNSTITLSRDGIISSRIQAGHISRFKTKTETFLDSGVVVDFYDKQGRHTSKLTSLTGTVIGKQNDLYARGNVVVVSDSGHVLRTEAIRWDHTIEKIISDTFVTITTEFDTVYGFGLVSDGQLGNWEIKKPTGTTVRELNLEREKKRTSDTTQVDTFDSVLVDS